MIVPDRATEDRRAGVGGARRGGVACAPAQHPMTARADRRLLGGVGVRRWFVTGLDRRSVGGRCDHVVQHRVAQFIRGEDDGHGRQQRPRVDGVAPATAVIARADVTADAPARQHGALPVLQQRVEPLTLGAARPAHNCASVWARQRDGRTS